MNLFESLQQLSESENIIKEADCCKGIFHFVNSDGNSLSMDEPELDEYKKFDGAKVKIIGNHVMNNETGEGYVDIEFPNGETLDYVSSSHIKYDIKESAVLKEVRRGRSLTVSEYNKLKRALNKSNTMKNKFVLHPGYTWSKEDVYIINIPVYGAFKDLEHTNDSIYSYTSQGLKNDEATREGVGAKLYTATINLIDESIKITAVNTEVIKRYLYDYKDYLIKNNIIDERDFDINTLKYSIAQVAENSKKDLEVALHSKNFIYNLTGSRKVKPMNSTDYNLNLENEALLKEDFDSSMPSWLARAIKMHNMSYATGHDDLEYNVPLDSMKWVVDDFPTTGKLNNIGNNEIIALLIDKSGDAHDGDYIVYIPTIGIGEQETIQINGRYRNISSMSLKALAPYVVAYAHTINSSSSLDDLKTKRNNRMLNKQGGINRASDDEIKYAYDTIYDKSGYLVDPTKYKKLLAQLHANDYSNRLEDLYVVLSDVKNKIKEFISLDDFLSDAKDNKPLYSKSKSDYFKDINDHYKDAITNYKCALEELEAIKSTGTSKNTWDDMPAYDSFNIFIKRSEKYTVDVLNLLDRLTK